MIRVPTADTSVLVYRNDPYILELIPKSGDYVMPPLPEFYSSKKRFLEHEARKSGNFYHSYSKQQIQDRCYLPQPNPACEQNTFSATGGPAAATHWAVVNFKFATRLFVAPFRVAAGALVVAEADFGAEQMGVVESVSMDTPPFPVTQKLLRHPRQKDVAAYAQCQSADCTVRTQSQQAIDALGVAATVVDVECQLDRTALTVCLATQSSPTELEAVRQALIKTFVCRVYLVTAPAPSASTTACGAPALRDSVTSIAGVSTSSCASESDRSATPDRVAHPQPTATA